MSIPLALLEGTLGRGGVVAYHSVRDGDLLASTHITPDAFRQQMEFLAGAYSVIRLGEFVARRRAGRSLRGCVAVTFDDAYVGVGALARPILERLGLPATIFVTDRFCDGPQRFWWDRFEWIQQRGSPVTRSAVLQAAGLTAEAPGNVLRDTVITRFTGVLPPDLDAAVTEAEREAGVVPDRAMTVAELEHAGQSDLLDFGCHTVNHHALPWLEEAAAEREIRANHAWLKARLPRVLPFLAYPFGLYTAASIRAARRAGMEAAFSIEGRAATSRFALFSCSRIGMADVNNVRGLRLRLAWGTIPLVALRNRSWHPRLRPGANVAPA